MSSEPPTASNSERSVQQAVPSERLLIENSADWLPKGGVRRAIVVSPGRAQVADKLVQLAQAQNTELEQLDAWYHDLHAATKAQVAVDQSVRVVCSPDLPGYEPDDGESDQTPYDLAVVVTTKSDEAELTRDILQQAFQRLEDGGRLVVSVDNGKDNWLHEQMQALFPKVTRMPSKRGCIYIGRRAGALKKEKDFWCQFPVRDEEGNVLQIVSRPGVFSHRRLDPGARQLMRSAEIGPDDRVLDFGCGAGVLSVTAAVQTSNTVVAVDSSTRAIQCAESSAAANGIENVQAIVNADGNLGLDGTIDLVLANPPYYGNDRISQHFVDSGRSALRSGGAMLVVTKKPSWYRDYFEGLMDDVLIFPSGKYFVACGRKP
ncbi:MAG: methyltransferase [Aureliella sp.]